MKDPKLISNAFDNEINWNPISLSEGYPGILLLFATMQFQDASYEQVVHKYVLAIKEHLEIKGLTSLSMFSGAAGICFSLDCAAQGSKRYEKMRTALHDFIFERVDSFYLKPLGHLIDTQRSTDSMLYDVIEGIAGLGGYALKNLHIPRFEKLSHQIVKILVNLCNTITVAGSKVPGWHLPSDKISGQFFASQNGYFNLGLAHGIAGVLCFLSIALLQGVEVPGQKEAIEKIAGWLSEWSFIKDTMIRWPYQISWEEETGLHPPLAEPSRDGWCYGVPGISRALYLAGKSLCKPDLKDFAMTAFLQLFNRSSAEWQAYNPALCHGLGGILLLAKMMAEEEGGESLTQHVLDLQKQITSLYDSKLPFGFNDTEQVRFTRFLKMSTPGFLEGTSGTLLSLLPLSHTKNNWPLPLMIYG